MKKIMITTVLMALMLMAAVAAYAIKENPVETFTITPNPMERDCTFTIALSSPLNISLQIQTLDGEVVRDIFSGYGGKNMVFTWDRTDDGSQYVPNGTYVAVLSYDARYTSTKKTLILK